MLFHDSGKPKCKSTDTNGIDHFYSHGKESKKIASEILTKLKTSTKFRNQVCNLVEYHDFLPHKISKKTYKKYIGKLGTDTVKQLFAVREADVKAQNPIFHIKSLEENKIGLRILEEIENESPCFGISDLAISGNELAAIGIEPSPEMGKILEILLDEVMEEKIVNTPQALIARALQIK